MIPPRPSLFALLSASLAMAVCAAPPSGFQTHDRAETAPSAHAAKAHKHHHQQERKGQNTTASASHNKTPATAPKQEPLVRWWMFKPQEQTASAPGKRGVTQNPRSKPQPTATSKNRAVAQAPNAKAKATPAPAANKRAVVQKTKPAAAPVNPRTAWFESKKPQTVPAPTRQQRQQTMAKNSRKAPAPIAVQAQQPPPRRDHPDRERARSVAASQYPVAKKSMQDGYVTSPYTRAKINVKRVPHGAQVLDPSSEKVFINP
jgi:hypothetical protein